MIGKCCRRFAAKASSYSRFDAFALLVLVGTCLLHGRPAGAQAAEPGAEAPLEEIVVTSRKREETLQSAPLSVTALSAGMIEARSLESFNDLNNYVPNIELNNGRVDGGGSVAQLFIRGVGQEDYSFPNDPGVGVYLDGIYVSRSSAGDFGFMDIERVEVLRGPQGTLYGKNTIGGAINVISRKPTGSGEGEIEVTFGRYDRLDLLGNFDVALTDELFLKVAGMTRSRDGYGVQRVTGKKLREENKDAGRVQLRYAPGDSFDALLQVEFSEQRGTGPVGAMRRFWPGDIANLINAFVAPAIADEFGLQPPFDVYGPAWVNRIDDTENFVSGGVDETRDNNEVFGASLSLDWDVGPVNLKSITGYRTAEIDVQRDGDHTPFPVFTVAVDEKTYQLSQEFQLSGDAFNGSLPWIVGLYGINERGRNSFAAPLLGQSTFDAIGLDISLVTNTNIDTVSLAVFGEASYYLTENLAVTVGGRFNRDDKEYVYQLDRIFSGASAIPRVALEDTWNEFLPKIGFEYNLTDDQLFYFNAAEGFKAGGWNPRTLTPGTEPQRFDPETIRTYELGFKTDLIGGRARLNAAAFFSEYEDIQLIAVTEVTLPDGTNTVDTTINNAGEGEIKGAELELTYTPVDSLLINAGVGLLDTEFTELGQGVIDAGTATLDNEFIQSPSVTFNGSIEYVHMLQGSGASLILFTDVAYKDDTERSVQNFEDLVTDAYWQWNGRVTYVPANERWEVAAFVTNITDEIYMTNGVDVRGLGATEAYYSRPREWGVTLRARF